jgi:hypothetical protein
MGPVLGNVTIEPINRRIGFGVSVDTIKLFFALILKGITLFFLKKKWGK